MIFYLNKCIFLFRVILCKYTLSEDILDSYFAYSIFIHASGFKQCSFKTSKISRFLLWNMPTSCFNTLLKIKESTIGFCFAKDKIDVPESWIFFLSEIFSQVCVFLYKITKMWCIQKLLGQTIIFVYTNARIISFWCK